VQHTIRQRWKQTALHNKLVILIGALSLIGVVGIPIAQFINKMLPSHADVSLLGECRILAMPVSIPAHEAIHLLPPPQPHGTPHPQPQG
jgi:hypothetical protein